MAEVAYVSASRVFAGSPPVRAVDKLDLDVADGEFLVLVGPSGSGKSTALRMLAGLEDVDEGAIRIGGRDVTQVPPKDRDIAMVFQYYALYPHMTVAREHGLRAQAARASPRRRSSDEGRARRPSCSTSSKYLDRKPKALSGGQRQRVAMGRAIVREPSVFLMDEPLSNLDAKLRVETRANIAALQHAARHHHHLRHARPGRGHDAWATGSPCSRTACCSSVDTPRNLYDTPGERVRGRLHRLARDEPEDGSADRRRRASSAASPCR